MALALPEPDRTIVRQRASIVADLEKLVPPGTIIADEEGRRAFETDALTAYRKMPLAVVLPSTTEEVSAVLKFCHEHGVKVVPRGAGTSLAGGAIASIDVSAAGFRGSGISTSAWPAWVAARPPGSGVCTNRQRPMAIIAIPSTTEYIPSSSPSSTYVASNRLNNAIRPRIVETTPEKARGIRKSGSWKAAMRRTIPAVRKLASAVAFMMLKPESKPLIAPFEKWSTRLLFASWPLKFGFGTAFVGGSLNRFRNFRATLFMFS